MDVLAAAADLVRADSPPAAARGQRTTTEQRWSVVALHKDERSNSYIARKLLINRATVRDILERYDATGSPLSGKRKGRPRCTDEALDTAIAFTARVDVFTSPRQIKRKLNLEASIDTVDRRLQQAGLFGRVARHKPDYTPAQRQARIRFARHYRALDWTNVLFSDEKCFYGRGFCGQTWVRREPGTALQPEYCVTKKAHPIKVNVWGCFTSQGMGYTYIFNENLDAALMKRILTDNLVPSAELHIAKPGVQWYVLHDNDKKSKSNLVQDLLFAKGVTALDFPPYSPDLNPMENLWATLARAVERYQADTIEALQDAVEAEWNKIDIAHLRNLVASMPSRCDAVILANGWHTSY
jgi:transposase